ncbi:hypothetical protein [Saccharothrix australiensis]|uniref:Uncharacterized protein n=1 Tax=Saccharothrix australiensis TaxID=2072 RepID=A0A495W279_9PSEU|nr:hypothetical protein [Saccharothrix australiensis]RKT55791.1 hypothetical protein C8E97_4478 [Saccharothrix australiensis]
MSTARAVATASTPRGLLLDQAWSALGESVAPLSNEAGRPLARTVKLILDPLVLRPVLHPEFAAGPVAAEHADALRERVVRAGPVLAATAAWFLVLKKERRRAGITDGNPQDLYFQRCYELATAHGDPRLDPAAAGRAADVLAEVHGQGGPTAAGLRRFVTDPGQAAELTRLLDEAWGGGPDRTGVGAGRPGDGVGAGRPGDGADRGWLDHDVADRGRRGRDVAGQGRSGRPDAGHGGAGGARPDPAARPEDFLATCATAPDPDLFAALVADRVGARGAVGLAEPGQARAHGLSDRDRPVRPELGATAATRNLPKPFDRSIVERLFVPLTNAHRDALADVPSLVRQEIARSAGPWQLAEEVGRVVMVLGRAASAGLSDAAPTGAAPTGAGPVGAELTGAAPTGAGPVDVGAVAAGLSDAGATSDAAARLRARWDREAYVRRVRRMPSAVPDGVRADVLDVRQAYLRRLWVRTHGRELRREPVPVDGLWDVLDGVLRSVILDQRDRLRSALERRAAG